MVIRLAQMLLIICLIIPYGVYAKSDQFKEELVFKTLPSGHIYGHFQFVTTWNTSLNSMGSRHYHLFPRPLGEIFETYHVKELHLSFTQGRWRHETWGYPIIDTSSGAELLAWFQASEIDVNSNWLGLINVLSGMFCASLNFMDVKSTVTPVMNFRQTGVTTDFYEQHYSKFVRYAVLPDEIVCTENLTPWKKLLPCGLKAGLSTLLNANKLYDASYHSLGIHFRHICMDETCTHVGLELSQTLGVVFDPIVNLGTAMKKPDWSFKRLFGRMISGSCPLASISRVLVDMSEGTPSLNSQPSQVARVKRGGADLKYAVYDIPEFVSPNKAFNLEVKFPQSYVSDSRSHPPFITTNRFQTGHGQVFGGVMCLIYNRHPVENVRATYLEIIPHYLRVYFHTLKIESFKGEIGSVGEVGEEVKPIKVHYAPGLDSGRPYHLEIAFRLPADSITRISFQFERQLLKWTDYPPDANHGFPVASSVLSILLPSAENVTSPCNGKVLVSSMIDDKLSSDSNSSGYFVKIHTEPLLVMLPTPDFSMPYNVICLVCTVVAISFASILNLTTKSFVKYDPEKHKNLFTKVKDKIWKKKVKTQ